MATTRQIMLHQAYTPLTGAPVCINCRHRNVRVLANRDREQICGLGGFQVNSAATCDRHEPPTADKNREVPA